MAFGRSNSLSINTGGSGSLFGNPASTSQPQQSGGLFGGGVAATSQAPAQSGGLLGSANTSQAQSSFGSTASIQPQQSSNLFGSNPAASQAPQTGGLFGGNNNAATTQPTTGGLFGQSTQQSQPQQSGGLFGGSAQQSQPQQSGGLFGQSTQQSQPQQSGGLFGGSIGQSQQPSNSLFGGQQANKSATGSFLPAAPHPIDNIRLGAPSTYSNSIAGSLTMGQPNSQQNTVPGTRIDVSNLRPTTRFSDLHDDLKKQIEAIDSFIRLQEAFSAQCEALLPNHAENVDSIAPDVQLISGKIDAVELALENDGSVIDSAKALITRDASDLRRCARVIENLAGPSPYHYGPSVNVTTRPRTAAALAGDDAYDVDLVGYFMRQADIMQASFDTYTSHMTEIENHLRVIEIGTVQQAQQLASQRTGSRAVNPQDTVRELAETLRAFEHGILGAAGLVGACREGVNELVLGRIDTDTREQQDYRARRTVRF